MSQLEDPFFAQLPSEFSTGVIRQFAPRINSTARRENITKDEFPQGCDALPGAFYVRYENVSALNDFPGFAFEACMPANMSAAPWRATRDRQDFSEMLYLAVNLTTAAGWALQVPKGAYFTRITVNTSAGFFELPNYMNGGIAGPLLAEDPTVRAPGKCDVDCETQTFDNLSSKSRRAPPSTNSNGTAFNATHNLEDNVNKGPLLQFAAFLANQAWMLSAFDGRLMVQYDLGADMQVPVLSLTGITVVSVVLGLFLLVLLGVAVYAWLTPTWATTLDAFAMLRIGAAVGAPLRPMCDSDEAENERLLLFPRDGAAGVST
ncbi:hypothetical protein B0H19DRAFT_1274063 [Mycena capillaripes]|nr:hypothetical protein B0H19DRAFT_1274063 [Mycena capillaripes]